MAFYTITPASPEDAAYITSVFPAVGRLSAQNRQRVLDAFCTVWKSSTFEKLEDAPFSKHSTHYPLYRHINEVVDFGLTLADATADRWTDSWQVQVDREQLLLLLLLHDLDKYLLLSADEGNPPLTQRIAHGTLSAMLLQQLGFEERVVGLVATHSPSSAVHTADPLAHILHYADLFSADHVFMLAGRMPEYCKPK